MISWYLNRLRTLSLPEYPYRAKQYTIKRLEELFVNNNRLHTGKVTIEKRILGKVDLITELSDPTTNIFGKKFNYSDAPGIDWHKDIFSGQSFPKKFSKKINILANPDLSAKAVWEINRLQFLTKVALDFKTTQDPVHLDLFIAIIRSWKADNPYLIGVNWYSNIEVNLRLINWFLCWDIMGADELMENNDTFIKFVSDDWLPLIYKHCIYSYKNPSKYSSANNHLISEYAGLFIASSKWRFKESEKWNDYSHKGMEDQITRQHSHHGINKEEAAEYIQFITDFFLIAYVVAENTNRPFSKQYKYQLHAIFKYIYHILDCAGHYPKYGDEDDGKCYIIDFDESFNNFASLLTAGAILFNDPVLKSKSNGFDIKNLVLFGEKGKEIFQSIVGTVTPEKSKFFKEEGHFIFREKEKDKEIYLHFNAAPLGFLSIAAHGHADALSFILHVDGHPIFIDSGTYAYHTESAWRNYFMGTLAHNTIRINKLHQANIGGPTLWLQHYRTRVLKTETNEKYDLVKAEHNGYKRFNITHTREINFNKKTRIIKIMDSLVSNSTDSYLIELPFHIHPLIKINTSHANQFNLLGNKGRNVTLQTDSKLKTVLVSGQTEPEIVGWYSKSFMSREPSNTLLCSLDIIGNINLETTITIN